MQAIGIVRRTDPLGRVVLPAELRAILNIIEGDPLEIFVDDDSILLRKYEPLCIFCKESNDITAFKGKNICNSCMRQLKNL